MKSSIKKQTFKAIYRLLDRVSPIDGDCGLLCGAACCTCQSPDMGIYLLPGEEKVFTRKESWLKWGHMMAEDYEFPDSWSGKVYFLQCLSAPHCDRHNRPIQCRTFPLAPHIDESGNLCMIYHSGQLPYKCPLLDFEDLDLGDSEMTTDVDGVTNFESSPNFDGVTSFEISPYFEDEKDSGDFKSQPHINSSHASFNLNADFIKATYTAWSHLIKDPLIYDLVLLDSDYRIEDREKITVLYP